MELGKVDRRSLDQGEHAAMLLDEGVKLVDDAAQLAADVPAPVTPQRRPQGGKGRVPGQPLVDEPERLAGRRRRHRDSQLRKSPGVHRVEQGQVEQRLLALDVPVQDRMAEPQLGGYVGHQGPPVAFLDKGHARSPGNVADSAGWRTARHIRIIVSYETGLPRFAVPASSDRRPALSPVWPTQRVVTAPNIPSGGPGRLSDRGPRGRI